jgi:hypothetical protein
MQQETHGTEADINIATFYAESVTWYKERHQYSYIFAANDTWYTDRHQYSYVLFS